MKKCERCGKEHEGTYGSGRFCSLSCANSRIISEEHRQITRDYYKKKREEKQQIRKNDIRTCEKCGKTFSMADVGIYSSGKFCSRKCANAHKKTEEQKRRISNIIKAYIKEHGVIGGIHSKYDIKYDDTQKRYYEKTCFICGTSFKAKSPNVKTCCKKCASRMGVLTKKERGSCFGGGYRQKSNRQYGGYYNGIWCDSRWELAFLIYCMDKNLPIQRCEETFEYFYENKMHIYHPDFKIGTVYYEIKGRWKVALQEKLSAVKNKGFSIKVIMKNEIKPYLEYCYETYHTRKLETLYDH